MGKRPNPALIGAFVVGAIALVVLAVVTFGTGRLFSEKVSAVMFFQGSVNGLEIGAPVKFRGVQIGHVTEIRLAIPEQPDRLAGIPVFIDVDAKRAIGLGAARIEQASIQDLIVRGLRAQLQLQSFITGVLYVGLDLFPDSEVKLALRPDSGLLEIPTLPTALEQVQARVFEVIDKIGRIDFDALGVSLKQSLAGVDKLVNSPELHETIIAARDALTEVQKLARELNPRVASLSGSLEQTSASARASLVRFDAATTSLRTLLDPRAPLVYEAGRTLEQLGAAADAVRSLAEYLQQNPSVLVRGKP